MTPTLPLVSSPAATPAARSVRAAGPSDGSFDALLARSGEMPEEADPAAWLARAGGECDADVKIREVGVTAPSPGFDAPVTFGSPFADTSPATIRADLGEDDQAMAAVPQDVAAAIATAAVRHIADAAAVDPIERPASAVSDAGRTSSELPGRAMEASEPAVTPDVPPPATRDGQRAAPAVEPTATHDAQPAATSGRPPAIRDAQPTATTGQPATLEALDVPRADAASEAVGTAAGGDAPQRLGRPADQAPGPAAPSASRRPSGVVLVASPRAEARAVAQSIVASALRAPDARESSTAAASSAVATVPIPAAAAVAATPAAAPARAAGRAAVAVDDPAPPSWAQAANVPVHAGTGRREGQEASHGRDGGPAAGKPPGIAFGSGLPASMIFPGQATFAAALAHAVPLSSGLPPAFATPALETVMPQIVRSLQMQVTAGGGEVTLTLRPEHLGTVTIELRVDQQRVSASLGADTPAVRAWIAAHQPELEAGLADLGLQLDEFVVRDDEPRERRQPDRPREAKPRKRVNRDDAIFDVRV